MKRGRGIGTFLALAILVFGGPVAAEVPALIDYHGFLTQADGTAKADGTYSLTFRLFGAASGGTVLWTETRTVTASKGAFSVRLGSLTALPGFADPRWLSVQVGAEPELPRTPLLPTPYALGARTYPPDSVSAASIKADSISSEDIDTGALVATHLTDRALDFQDFSGPATLVPISCDRTLTCSGEPCDNNSGPPDSSQRLCSTDSVNVAAPSWGIVFATVSIELGCRRGLNDQGALMAGDLQVVYGATGQAASVADTARVTTHLQVSSSPASTTGKSGFGEMTVAVPIALAAGRHYVQVNSSWSGTGCRTYSSDFSAKWTNRQAHVLILGRRP